MFFRCNKGLTENYVFLEKVKFECKDLGFGFFTGLISADVNPWHASIFIFFVSTLFFSYLIYKVNIKNLYISILFVLSPAFRFLLFSLNPDIIFLLFFLYFIIFKNFHLDNFGYIFISFLIQTKFFPIGILFGLAVYFYLYNEKHKLIKLSIFTLSNLALIVYDILTGEPSVFSNSF